MANNNLLQTIELIEKANSILTQHAIYLDESAASLKNYTSSAKLPSEYVNNLRSIDESNKKIVSSNKELVQSQKQLERERLNELKLQQKREVAFDRYEKQLQREQRLLNRTTGLYNAIQKKVNDLSREYNNLAAKKELGRKLSIKEEAQLGSLTTRLNKYQDVLKKVDADIQKNQRNVGNYKSGFDGLGFSIAQLSREMPAFANSMQTGFMAISNNIPMLVDEINRLKLANKQLAADGQPTVSILSKLGSALFGWQTLISVGVTVMTVYGKEIVNWAADLLSGDKAVKSLAENTKELNKQSAEIASQSIPKFKALTTIVQDLTQSEEKRKDAIEELKKEYPDFNAQILLEKDNTYAVNTAIAEYINKLGQKAKAQASMNMMQEKYNLLILQEQKTNEILQESTSKKLSSDDERQKRIQELISSSKKFTETESQRNATEKAGFNAAETYLNKYNSSKEKESEIQQEINDLMSIYIDNVDLSTTAVNKNTKAEDLKNGALIGSIAYYEAEISKLQTLQKTIATNQKEWNFYQKQIDSTAYSLSRLLIEINGVNNGLKSTSDYDKAIESIKNHVKEMEATLPKEIKLPEIDIPSEYDKDYYRKNFMFSDDEMSLIAGQFDELGRLYNIDASKFTALFDKKENTVNDYVAAAGEAMKGLYNAFAEDYTDDLYRLQESANLALLFAGDNAAAQEEIREQQRRKEAEIRKKQAKQDRDQALFNIFINTARAVTAALTSTPPNIPLSIIVGGIGLAQAAAVASRDIPQFKDGVRDFGGGLAVVGDGGVNEVITTKEGKAYKTPNKDTLVNLPKGANVYKNENEFNKELQSMLNINGIMPFRDSIGSNNFKPIINVENGISKDDFNAGIKNLSKTINNKVSTILNIDKNGVSIYQKQQHAKTEILNNRFRHKGKDV